MRGEADSVRNGAARSWPRGRPCIAPLPFSSALLPDSSSAGSAEPADERPSSL
jgi:hypothetical protein